MNYLRQFGNSYYNPGGDTIDTPPEFRLFRGLDELHFNIPCGFPAERYEIAVETLDTASTPWKKFSRLRAKVNLPAVHLGPYAKLAVLPDSPMLPAFYGIVHRGGKYSIPSVSAPGRYMLEDNSMMSVS